MSLAYGNKTDKFLADVVFNPTTGKKEIKYKSEIWFNNFLSSKLSVGDHLLISITNRKPRRTILQNNYYWGAYLPLIAAETGEEDLERLHELFKGKFLTETIAEVLGEKVRIKKSTTELSVGEFIEYIEQIERFTGIPAPPTENWGLQLPKKVAYACEDY